MPKSLPQGQGPDAMRTMSPMSNRTSGNHLFPKVVTKIRPTLAWFSTPSASGAKSTRQNSVFWWSLPCSHSMNTYPASVEP